MFRHFNAETAGPAHTDGPAHPCAGPALSARPRAIPSQWAASSFLSVEKGFRRIMGYPDLWMPKAALDKGVDKEEKAG
jgi:hypothetical protein